MDDQIEQAVEIGRENARLISLGKAWCTHIRTDRSDLGVGMVEEMTGLPITGGRFTCDFAQRPGELAGMQLAATALGFYEDNCRGCRHRAPGGRVPNLSIWAEPLLAERDEREKAEAAAQQAALAERQKRADHRTLVAASLAATGQEIVGLINRIDLEPSDTDAQESIRALARLAPDSFADDVKEMLYTDARMLRSSVLLGVLVAVDMPGAQLHGLCLDAVRGGWGRAEGCRYLSEHGSLEDLDQDLLDAIVFHAAPAGWLMVQTRGEPAALLHYHFFAPDAVEHRVRTLLGHGEARRRAAAAAASEALVGADPTCGQRLVTALVDGLRHQEDLHDVDRAAGEITSVVGVILQHAPHVVDAAVERRWRSASPEYRSRLMGCYDFVFRRWSEQLSAEVGRVVIARAVAALSESLGRSQEGLGDDFQGQASELLEMAVRACPTDVLTPERLIGLLLDWLDRDRNLAETEPTDFLSALEKMDTQARIGRVVRNIVDAAVALGQRDPSAFIAVCSDLYSGTETAPFVRGEVVRMAGRVAAASSAINDALPLIYTAMLGDNQSVRAGGMEAAERVMQAIPRESIPPLLAEAVVTGLTDQYLIVVMAAIKAACEVPADLIDHRAATVNLLATASAYASDRLRDQLVQDALWAAHRLVRDDQHLLGPTRAEALEIVKLMPAYNARKTLRGNGWLELHDNWADAAIHALRIDDDRQYENLGDDDKESLLEKLGHRRLITHQIDALAAVELESSKLDWRRSLLAAELFSELGRPDLSARMIGAHLESVPDTIEKQPTRRSMEQILLVYSFEEAIALGQDNARREVLNRVEELCAGE